MMVILEAKGITKAFGGLLANSNIDLTIEAGEIIGLIGPNGAGKTTFFNSIAGVFKPDEGKIIFCGENITGLPPETVCRKGIARTFQLVKVFKEMSVLENVMVGSFANTNSALEARKRAFEELEFFGFKGKAYEVAGGLTMPDQKRLELTRAMATNPKLLMLDEVMAGLTASEVKDAVSLIKKINKDREITFLIVEHVMEVIMPISDRVVVFDYGIKIAEDVPEKIAHNVDVIKAYLGDKYNAVRS
jgi:branched-chain amino acid transport system ATP-binding protein